jgi:hypothetical protein
MNAAAIIFISAAGAAVFLAAGCAIAYAFLVTRSATICACRHPVTCTDVNGHCTRTLKQTDWVKGGRIRKRVPCGCRHHGTVRMTEAVRPS